MFSVLILVKNRQSHLENVLRGIEQSSLQPSEIIVVHMNESPSMLSSELMVSQLEIHTGEPLPLAKARNTAAKAATNEQLIFLDVDCIPAPDCFETLLQDLENGTVTMVDPYYLQDSVTTINYDLFSKTATANPARDGMAYGVSNRYELFWSLGFAMNKSDFMRIGGFDESYRGYGGEDTDFAFTAREHGLKMFYSQAKVFHQPHASYDPPLNWLSDIVANAEVFYKKWQRWPMEGWLGKFQSAGYIDWQQDSIKILALPDEAAIERARK